MRTTFLLLALLATVATVKVAADATVSTPDGFKVDFVGQSGQIKLYPGTDSNSFIKVKWSKLQEVTPSGAVVQSVNNFASQSFVWTVNQVQVQGYNATEATLTSTLSIKAGASVQFSVSAYIYQTQVTLVNGNTTVIVPKNNVKFSVTLGAWPFASTNNSLQFGADVVTPNNNAGVNGGGDSSSTTLSFGAGNLNIQNYATVDGVQKSITSTIVSTPNVGVQWTFPYYTSSLYYDPNIGYGTASSAATSAPSMIVALTAILATIYALMQ